MDHTYQNFLLKKNYVVHGVKRRSSSLNTARIDSIYQEPFVKKKIDIALWRRI